VIRTELSLRLPNNAGALAGVLRALDEERIRVLAMSIGEGGWLRLLVYNHVHGAGALRARRHVVTERDVLVVDGVASLGALQLIADAQINVNYAYGSATMVLGVDDVLHASARTGI
jgi:hypothetical protein